MRVLSLGAGVQSSTLLLMACEGELEIDAAVFADTGWEPRAVYEHLDALQFAAEQAGISVHRVSGGNLRDALLSRGSTRTASIPLYVRTLTGEMGTLRRQCTKEYKTRPVQRWLREHGATRKQPATVLIGFSWDETERMADSRVQYAVHEYPLIERRMTRQHCEAWLARRGWAAVQKSSCVGCPFHTAREWRGVQSRPTEWAEAVAVDEAIRRLPRIKGEAYLHRSLKPLPMVDFRTEQERGQLDLFSCSPFGCVTGEAA